MTTITITHIQSAQSKSKFLNASFFLTNNIIPYNLEVSNFADLTQAGYFLFYNKHQAHLNALFFIFGKNSLGILYDTR